MTAIIILAFACPCALSAAATYVVRAWAMKHGFVDTPAGHKQHAQPVALGGGVALLVATCAPLLIGCGVVWLTDAPAAWWPQVVRTHAEGIAAKAPMVLAVVAGAVVLHVVGLIDDRRALGPWVKLSVQFAVAAFIAGPIGIRAVEFLPAPVSFAVTVFWIVLITNAFNFLDNMDGLSAGVAAVAAAIFATASLGAGQVFVPIMAFVAAGALAGFLPFNFSPASIFMGDAGSLVVGYLMAVITILVTFYDRAHALSPLGVLVPLLVLAVPLYDVASVVTLRMRVGKSPLRGDHRHFSHRLVRRGMTPRGAVLTIYLATAATGLSAVVVPRVPWPSAVLLLVQCACVVLIIAILEHTTIARNNDPRRENDPQPR